MKLAVTDLPILDIIKKRWSPVTYSSKPVEQEKLLLLLEAARWAPSCYNEQPWQMIFGIQGQGESHERLLSVLVEGNQAWAHQVPVLGLTVAALNFARSGKPNRHATHDVGLAMGQLCLQAMALDLYVHQMAGFRVAEARELFHIPEGYEPVAAFGIGYLGDISQAPEEHQKRDRAPRTRREVAEFAFLGDWKQPLDLEGKL